MKHFLSNRIQAIPESGIRAFFDLVLNSEGIISLGVGEPDFLTPWAIRDEAIYRLEKGRTSYTSNKGLLELRQAICNYLRDRFFIHYSPESVLITNGVSEGVDIVLRAILNDGDEVILPEPAYVCYRPLIQLAGGVVRSVDTSGADFMVTASAIEAEISDKTKAIILSYPNNPTGQSIDFDELKKIAAIAKARDCLIITDEIYADLSFDKFQSIATIEFIKDQLVYLNGFSKAHSMTGWRVGYVCAPSEFIDEINKIHQYSALCAPTVSQYAAIEACQSTQADVDRMRQSYLERAQYFTRQMNHIGLATLMPTSPANASSS